MKRFVLLCFVLVCGFTFSQPVPLVWEQPNTGVSSTISVGEFSLWEMVPPTLNGEVMPVGALIGVFFQIDGEFYCGGFNTWSGDGMIAISAQGDDSTTPNIDGFSEAEAYSWFAYYDGFDYYASNAVMVEPNGQLTGTVYNGNALSGLASADFTDWTGVVDDEVELTCECEYGMAVPNGDMCMILNACDDPLASNYCPGLGPIVTSYFNVNCIYDEAVEGCICPDAYNYDDQASADDGTCLVLSGGCSDPLAANYSGDECASALFAEESCVFAGCMCSESYNYDPSATIDDGSCLVISGGCSDPTANNYSGDECASALFAAEDCQYTPLDVDLEWNYDITDGNMTIQISSDVVTFNGDSPPLGSLIGVFFTNNNGDLQNAGYLEWTGDQLALAAWASESGFDNGFEAGEELVWGLSIGNDDFLATSSGMNTSPPFSETFVSNGFGQLLSVAFEGELTSILGCTNESAYNYNSEATVDDGSCYSLDFDYTITDGNMTIQVSQSAVTFNGIGVQPPCGSLLGGFYTNDLGQLQCAGYQVWCDDFDNNQLAIPLFASESGEDNGFETGEYITWILSVYGQSFVADYILMNPSPPFSETFIANGFGQILVAEFSGEIEGVIGCTNETADNYNPDATISDDSCEFAGCTDETACNFDPNANLDDSTCYYETIWYYDEDGDGLGDDIYFEIACDPPAPDFADNSDDPCPYDSLNISGCIDESAFNYNEEACYDDGSCIAVVLGCTDPSAFNYNEAANTDDNSCEGVLEGCIDESAFNYNEVANTNDDSCCYISGCTDLLALNYNVLACYDDGSCIAVIEGCTDPSSFNYNPDANSDDGTCVPYIFGCIDLIACNYDDLSNTDNGSCEYAIQYYDCDNNCLIDVDGDGVCDELEFFGCTDENALNYNSDATEDDGSCITAIFGCTDSLAFNYNESANTNDDSCCYISGCTDLTAFNYNEGACYDDGTCLDVILGCTDSSAFNYNENANTDDGTCVDYVYGCTNPDACNYDENSNTDNGSCEYPDEYYDCDGNCINDIDLDGTCDENEVGGCTDPNALNYNSDATEDDFCLFTGCLDALACNFDPIGTYNVFNECEYSSCSGCTDTSACNYDGAATLDDDSCIYANANADCNGDCLDGYADFINGCELIIEGCVNVNACNYNENANIDDGSCEFLDGVCDSCEDGLVLDNDLDNDGVCDADEMAGCTDTIACNYDLMATDDDSSCVYPLEGFDCDGNELELDTPWGNNDGCDPFNNHTVAFTVSDGLNNGDFIGLFYTSENGDLIFSQAVEYNGTTFYFTVCGDDASTEEKDGFDIGESFIWQLWPTGEDCAYSIDVEYSSGELSSGEYEVNGISQVVSISGSSLEASVSVTDALCNGDLGSAELTVTGGTAPYDIDDLSALSAGSYTTIVTDANGCSVSLDFDIVEPEPLDVIVNTENVLCNGDSNGSALIDIIGGSGEYDYEIQVQSESLQENNYSMSFNGDDELILTNVNDFNGDEFTIQLDALLETYGVLFQSNGPHVTFTYSENCGCSNPTNDFNVPSISFRLYSGGWTVLSYPVSSLDLSNPINIAATKNGNSVKLYIDGVLVDEASSGVSSVSGETAIGYDGFTGLIDNVAIWGNSLDINQIDEFMNCPPIGDEIELLNYFDFEEGPDDTPYDLSQGANYSLESVNNCFISESVFVDDLDNLSAGDYVITVFDSNGCLDVSEFSILEPEELSLTFDSTAGEYSNCNSGSASVFIDGGTAPYTYLWSNGENTSELLEICGGEYFVTITDSNGCVIEGSVIVDYLVPEGWDVSITDITHTIDIPTDAIMLLDQIDLVLGDYIGVFFDNEDGSASCGGYVMLIDGTMQLVAYGNDGVNDGFDQDDQFDWKLWDSATETTISGFGVYDDSYPDERFFNAGGESGLLGSVFASHQIIPLNESSYSDWDMISTYISTDENLESIVSPVINELIIIKDANGLVYWPQIPVYTLDNFNTEDAYAIKTYASNELVIYGDFTQPEDVLFELSGWNYMSYPRYFPLDPETVFSEVENSIKLLKDDSGNLYWPELGINTINQMEAGEGYVLKVLSDESFTYPSNSDYVNAIDGSTTAGRIGFNQPVYYSDYEATNSNMVIGIPFDLWIDFDLQYGDEIAVYDTQENIVGVSVLNNDNNVIVVWGDDISSDLKDGMYNGEEFSFELWQQSSNKLYDVKFEWQEGANYYSENGINIASNIEISSKYDVSIENVYCYPNPSSGEFNLEFYLNDDSDVKVNIYNSIGELVNSEKTFYCYNGTNTLPFSMNHLSQGLYYIKLTTSTENINIVIELTK